MIEQFVFAVDPEDRENVLFSESDNSAIGTAPLPVNLCRVLAPPKRHRRRRPRIEAPKTAALANRPRERPIRKRPHEPHVELHIITIPINTRRYIQTPSVFLLRKAVKPTRPMPKSSMLVGSGTALNEKFGPKRPLFILTFPGYSKPPTA